MKERVEVEVTVVTEEMGTRRKRTTTITYSIEMIENKNSEK